MTTLSWRQKRLESARRVACPFCQAPAGALCGRYERATGITLDMPYDVHIGRVRRAKYNERMAAK